MAGSSHEPSVVSGEDWSRLAELTRRLGARGTAGSGRRGSPAELREFWRQYRAATARLAERQAEGGAAEGERELNRLVAAAHAVLYRDRPRRPLARRLVAFLATGWPTLVRRHLRLVGAAAGVFALGGVLGGWYAARDPSFVGLVAPPELLASVESGELWTRGILSIRPAASSLIFSNNATVAITTFALGITAGLGTLWILLMNGVSLGAIAVIAARHGLGGALAEFVVGHGTLELPAIFVAGAAGLLLGGALVRPGDRTRGRAVAAAGRDAVRLLAGCAPVLVVAAAIEGFLSPGDLPGPAKVAVGTAAFLALVAWVVRGRAPEDRG